MKFLKSTCVLLIFASLCIKSQAQEIDLKVPVQYLNYIGTEYNKILKEQWDYTKAVAHGKRAKVVDKRRKDLLAAMDESKRIISRMPPLNKSSSFRDSIVAYLRIARLVINEDYEKIINMEEVAEQSYDLMEAYLLAKQMAGEKLTKAAEMVSREQDKFTAENNILLKEGPESKLSKNMREAGDAFEYYNKVYLLFFKNYKQDLYLVDALNASNINSIEQNRNALLNYSIASNEELKKYTNFKKDATLSTACREILMFYKNEAEHQIPVIMDFFTTKNKFDKITTTFNNIKPTARTQKDIDVYNNAIKEMNTASLKYNDTNKKLNESRSKLLDNWNKKSEAFLNTHVP